MMFDAEIHCSFSLMEFRCDPMEITRTLKIKPTRSWVAGQITPPLPMRRPASMWQLSSRLPHDRGLGDHVGDVLARITPVAELVRNRPWGGVSEIACAIYVYGPEQPPAHIAAADIAGIAALGAELDIDLYQLGTRAAKDIPA